MGERSLVKCHDCGWEGDEMELKASHKHNIKLLGDIIPELTCPKCESENVYSVEYDLAEIQY